MHLKPEKQKNATPKLSFVPSQRLGPLPPDLQFLSKHLYVPFEVRRFSNADLVWINNRWFQSRGVDLNQTPTATEVEQWLLEQFAVGAWQAELPHNVFKGASRPFFADRYGATGGSTQGGSGRVGSSGGFNVKGIGRTPLASRVADWQHSHGSLWLEEAVREAIYSEVIGSEFPHGAVPVIAIITLNMKVRRQDTGEIEERALLVRPNFLRMASLQRTIFFGDAGHCDSDQYRDALRVEHLWTNLWSAEFHSLTEGVRCETLAETFGRLGEQYGYGQATRVWPGPIFSSNVTLDGRLVDFGSARTLPNWKRAQSKLPAHAFGAERTNVERLAHSLSSTARKHGRKEDSATLIGAYDLGRLRGFDGALQTHGVERGSDWATRLHALFDAQQQRRGTLWDDEPANWPFGPDHVYGSLLMPRSSLFREGLQTRIRSSLKSAPAAVKGRQRQLTMLIDSEVRQGRRLPPVGA